MDNVLITWQLSDINDLFAELKFSDKRRERKYKEYIRFRTIYFRINNVR